MDRPSRGNGPLSSPSSSSSPFLGERKGIYPFSHLFECLSWLRGTSPTTWDCPKLRRDNKRIVLMQLDGASHYRSNYFYRVASSTMRSVFPTQLEKVTHKSNSQAKAKSSTMTYKCAGGGRVGGGVQVGNKWFRKEARERWKENRGTPKIGK